MEKYKEIEKSIIKKYRKEIWSKFAKAIDMYNLIEENDKIAVCISGGKDSFLLAKCMQEIQRHGKIKFELEFIVMNPGYTQKNAELIKKNAELLNIPITIFESDIFSVVTTQTEGNPCYLCARMRRGYLYSKAKELGCNKIALGHHFDDVIETVLLSMFYGAEFKTMLPKLKSDNFSDMELIRPLYLVRESSIIQWKTSNELEFLNCACKFTLENEIDENKSKRKEMKQLIKNFNNKNIDNNIFTSTNNININTVLGYHKDGKKYSFLDDYNIQMKEFNISEDLTQEKIIVVTNSNKYVLDEKIKINNQYAKIIGLFEYNNIEELLKDHKEIINLSKKRDKVLGIKIRLE